MFSFFSKKPSTQDSVTYMSTLAKEAVIDAVLENGNYSGFLISLDIDAGGTYVKYFANQEALEAFIGSIEERINNGNYNDPGDDGMVKEMREMSGWKKNLNVIRVVLGRGNKSLFQWNPPVI
jgi:hypothetical protein